MVSLARRNLLHDKVRLMVTLTGIVFSVVLTAVQLGLFVGFERATSDLIDHSRADLWITSKDLTHIEDGLPFSERKLYQVLAVPGVERAQKHIAAFSNWKKPNGAGGTQSGCLYRNLAPGHGLGSVTKIPPPLGLGLRIFLDGINRIDKILLLDEPG